MQAIRIDGKEVLHGGRHIDILTEWMERENMTDEQTDEAIEAGRIEFGSVHWDHNINGLAWSVSPTRNDVYKSVYYVRACGI